MLSELYSTGSKKMRFKGLVVKLGFPHIVFSDPASLIQIWFHLSGS